MAHFDIPLDLPHAARIADRLQILIEQHAEDVGMEPVEVMDVLDEMTGLLFRHSEDEENPPMPLALEVRDKAALLGRKLVDALEESAIRGDRLGQLVRNYFECLELGEEGAALSLRAGENPASLQRPI